ncbi:MAG: hypothetical protein V7L01_11125 [Nostoc sp.]|uniref:hypothetical protein n=1 Tax=Nostoc sp. TaxID=1180 RepID=UPI002FF578D1
MGNTILPVGDGADESASRWMKAAGIAIDEEHYRKVANAKDIDKRTYTSRQHQDYLKPEFVLECENAFSTRRARDMVQGDCASRS